MNADARRYKRIIELDWFCSPREPSLCYQCGGAISFLASQLGSKVDASHLKNCSDSRSTMDVSRNINREISHLRESAFICGYRVSPLRRG
jgi:hypothetical protein